MEYAALIKALKMLRADEKETIYLDSQLCLKTLTEWAPNWERKGWKKKGGPIKNLELVQEAYSLYQKLPNLTLEWTRGHQGWRWNEYVDSLASAWCRETL